MKDDGSNSITQVSENSGGLVTESFLSLAKDFRYLKTCRNLLAQAIEAIEPMALNARTESKINKVSWFLSSFLYVMVVIAPSGRTLGMESCGLVFKGKGRGRLVASLLTTIITCFGLDYIINRGSDAPREELRGNDRLEMHRLLRTQMIQRAALQSTSNPQTTTTTTTTNTAIEQNENGEDALWKRIMKSLCSSLESLASEPEGPHSLNFNTQTSLSTTTSLIGWMLRLHIAHYCVTGKYPTPLHRLLNLRHDSDGSSPIIFHPKTNRLVALLIGIQASTTLTRFILNVSAQKMAKYIESRTGRSANTPLNTKLFPLQKRKKVESKLNTSKSSCGICRLRREHPAAPIACGHVFCWDCLMQWVSNVKACPLCRTPCKPQDIICLYKYD